jgi:two-component system chemotaxis sensor kinase CheA
MCGACEVEPDLSALPALELLDPETSYLGWLIRLKAPVARATVTEVFAWVEEDADLTIEPLPADVPVAQRQGGERRGAEDRRAGGNDSTSIRVDTAKVDGLINMVGELVITQNILQQIGEHFDMGKLGQLCKTLADLERNTRELQESVMRIRMLPMSFAFNRFPRLVHDVSQKLGKKVELKMQGEGTELDKTVLEKIVDPLVHLVRNSLDHGIEMPDARRAAGKPETGQLLLSACHKGGNVEIEISDDGAGLNKDKILRKARERGLVKESDLLTDEQIHELIFLPGFSTADTVSNISGRGVGMDVVKRSIQALGGRISIASRPGQGSTFTMSLPLTLAVLDGMVVRVADQTLVVPLTAIVETLKPKQGEVRELGVDARVISNRGKFVPLIDVGRELGYRSEATDPLSGVALLVETERGACNALLVDTIQDQRQVVIKSLETNYGRVPGVAAATILGDGRIALILDVDAVVARSGNDSGGYREPLAAAS